MKIKKNVVRPIKKLFVLGLACAMTVGNMENNVPYILREPISILAEENNTVVWSNDGGISNGVVFTDTEDWDTWDNQLKLFVDGNGESVDKGSLLRYTVTIDEDEYKSLAETGYIKIEVCFFNEANNWDNVVKLGWPMYYASDFSYNGNGTYSKKVEMEFDNDLNNFSQVLFRGVGTLFAGEVEFSDISIITEGENLDKYVNISEQIKEEVNKVDTSKMLDKVKLVDANATDETKTLASYLHALRNDDKVLFGHQNSTFRSVRDNGQTSDIKDITGSEAGLFGIDSLSLSGVETSKTTTKEAIEASVEATLKAYNGGSIITLSCHMPNFTSDKIVESDDKYKYDFTKCDFEESKDLTPCIDYILEGEKYNDRFNAYLDIIADYALTLQEKGIPVLFRPFHESSGGWFWWGSLTSPASYKAAWRYVSNYLDEKGVHNFIYVYSPNGPFTDEEKYLERYPGDEYVDVVAFDYYDDYADVNTYTGDTFFENLKISCEVVNSIANKKGKIPAIAETGIRITGAGRDSLIVSGNPTTGHDWYNKLIETAVGCDLPYFLLWANFDDKNFFVPYKYNDTLGHEMINEFIAAYNNDKSIFGNGTNFYIEGDNGSGYAAISKSNSITLTGYSNELRGYVIEPKNYSVIKEECILSANVKNADKVSFVLKRNDQDEGIVVDGIKTDGSIYNVHITEDILKKIGETGTGSVLVYGYSDEKEVFIGGAYYISFNKDPDVMPMNIIDNFEYYYGNEALLNAKWGECNSAGGCDSYMSLEKDRIEGDFGGAFNYSLKYKGSEVWTGGLGKSFDKTDCSQYNAISMWVKPDGNGQKMVIQLNDNYEAYLTEFVKTNKSAYVTIPFSSFIKKGGSECIDASNITSFKLWCNSIPENYTGEKDDNGYYTVNGKNIFDDIEFVKISNLDLAKTNDSGLIISNEKIINQNDSENDKDNLGGENDKINGGNDKTKSDGNKSYLKKGSIIKDDLSRAEYVVLSANEKNGEVAYIKTVSKKSKNIVIPATIKKDGITYKVTVIKANAFKNNKRITKVIIGKNVKIIGKKAFYNCRKLKKVIIKSKKINKIGKKAFYRRKGEKEIFKYSGNKKKIKILLKKAKTNNYIVK